MWTESCKYDNPIWNGPQRALSTTPMCKVQCRHIWKHLCIRRFLTKKHFLPPPTVLRFVGPTDNIYSCSFVQMLAQRLENAFDEAQDKVLETYNRVTVEVRSRLVGQSRWSMSTTRLCLVLIRGKKPAALECIYPSDFSALNAFRASLALFSATSYFSFPIDFSLLLLWLSTR